MKSITLFLIPILLLGCTSQVRNGNLSDSVSDSTAIMISKTKSVNVINYSINDSILYDFLVPFINQMIDSQIIIPNGSALVDMGIIKGFNWLWNLDTNFLAESENFSIEDIEFFFKQIEERQNYVYDSLRIPSLRLIPADSFYYWVYEAPTEVYFSKRTEFFPKRLYIIGTPVFSKDLKRVIIDYGYSCGALCGEHFRDIYRKNNKGWVFYKRIMYTIS